MAFFFLFLMLRYKGKAFQISSSQDLEMVDLSSEGHQRANTGLWMSWLRSSKFRTLLFVLIIGSSAAVPEKQKPGYSFLLF